MKLKHALAALSLVAVVIAAIAMTSPTAQAGTKALRAPATVIKDFDCGVIDGDGGFFLTDASLTVITSSGNSILKCSAKGVPNSTGQAVQYDDFECGTFIGTTFDSHETVSASGNVTLTCKVH